MMHALNPLGELVPGVAMKPMPDETLEKLLYFRQEIDKIFQEFFDAKSDKRVEERTGFEVPVDVFDRSDEFLILVEIPGVQREDLSLSALRDLLIIEGVKRRQEGETPAQYLCAEREFGPFRRFVDMPAAGDMSRVEATLREGVLLIRLPKIQERRGRKIPIKIG